MGTTGVGVEGEGAEEEGEEEGVGGVGFGFLVCFLFASAGLGPALAASEYDFCVERVYPTGKTAARAWAKVPPNFARWVRMAFSSEYLGQSFEYAVCPPCWQFGHRGADEQDSSE